MRVMVFGMAAEPFDMSAGPTPEMLEAFAAMDRFTEQLVAAGVFVAAAGLKNGPEAKRLVIDRGDITVTDGPFAESKELVAGFQIWNVRDMDEALAWARRAPVCMPGKNHMEIRAFYEPEDLSEFVTPEELAAPRDGERGALGVA